MKKFLFYPFLILTLLSCGAGNSPGKEAETYLEEIIDLLQEKSVSKNTIDWKEFRKDVLQKAGNAKTIADTYPAVTYAVFKLGDHHSYFRPANEPETASDNKPLPVLPDESTPLDIGYIRLPFCIGTEQEVDDYILNIQAKIEEQSKRKLKGWIIDLRGNFGGNMWPMLLSIEPFLGNGTFGYFVNANDQSQAWKLNKGRVYLNTELVYKNKQYKARNLNDQFVAVLTDQKTASSGEAIAVALKCRPKTKSFGKPTYGVSTGCVSHQLSDGSSINLAESVFADREMKKYGGQVSPDVITEEEETLEAGIGWIYKMNTIKH